MKENLDKNTTIKEVVERYLKQENMSIYKLSKESKLSVKTIKKMLKNTSSNFNKKTLEKLCTLKKLNSDDKKDIKLFFKDKKSKKENDIEKINIILSSLFEENKKLKEENKKLETLNLILADKPKKYNDLLKVNSFKSDFETTTKIIPLMWKLNDEVAKLFSELELLLEINNQEENRKMKIGLNKIADNLIDIGTKLKKYGENNKNEEQIIDMEVK
ncbi:helix-turn-helix transcriptional regulator [Fusobacterium nucleatum]|uniref:helix-turn-helix domain-containing protein n=1 Tax=Fusobacterium nucleatum TaxID=851 RepID=UPI0030CC391D